MKRLQITSIAFAMMGVVTQAGAASHFKALFIEQYDQDGDGVLGSVEFEQARRARFDLTDVNRNGTVDPDEYLLEWENRLDPRLARDREAQMKLGPKRFEILDDDGNGTISAQEFNASGERAFAELDKNRDNVVDETDAPEERGDGAISRGETLSREAALKKVRRILWMPTTHDVAGMRELYDDDGDGAVSREEFAEGRRAQFTRMDSNGNGAVEEGEYLAEFAERVEQKVVASREGQVKQTGVRFDALDESEDGIMTFEEYQRSGHHSFKRWDTDGDGYVTWEEAAPALRERQAEDDAGSDGDDTGNAS